MIELPHAPSGLSKATWTDADFPDMGWHDCRVHAVSVGEYEDDTLPPARLLLDLDYIVRWVEPERSTQPFTFWITPATLLFERAWNVTGRFGPLHEVMEIADVHRLDPPDGNPEPLWHIDGQNFEIRLRASSYVQYLRTPPQHVTRRILTMPNEVRSASHSTLSLEATRGSAAIRALLCPKPSIYTSARYESALGIAGMTADQDECGSDSATLGPH